MFSSRTMACVPERKCLCMLNRCWGSVLLTVPPPLSPSSSFLFCVAARAPPKKLTFRTIHLIGWGRASIFVPKTVGFFAGQQTNRLHFILLLARLTRGPSYTWPSNGTPDPLLPLTLHSSQTSLSGIAHWERLPSSSHGVVSPSVTIANSERVTSAGLGEVGLGSTSSSQRLCDGAMSCKKGNSVDKWSEAMRLSGRLPAYERTVPSSAETYQQRRLTESPRKHVCRRTYIRLRAQRAIQMAPSLMWNEGRNSFCMKAEWNFKESRLFSEVLMRLKWNAFSIKLLVG